MHKHSFKALGATFTISVWDQSANEKTVLDHVHELERSANKFESTYSRFLPDSFLSHISGKVGTIDVGTEMVEMLRLYEQMSDITNGIITPTVGFALEDTGYDSAYSLTETPSIREAPPFSDTITVESKTSITIHKPIKLDFGALGKGFLVDSMYALLHAAGYSRFLVNGSGDIRYYSANESPIACGLEHPNDPEQVIGKLNITSGALCASGQNRRKWHNRSHLHNPKTQESPGDILSSWVTARTAVVADMVATALFFVPAETLSDFTFEYLLLNNKMQIKRSEHFAADLFKK